MNKTLKTNIFAGFSFIFGCSILAVLILSDELCYNDPIPDILSSGASTQEETATWADDLIYLHNVYRVDNKLSTLHENEVLNDIAKQKVYHMLGNCYFTHYFNDIFYSPELAFGSETPLYRYNYWGENLGDGYKTLQPMFTAWIESEAHKKNMVKPEYAEIGVYVYPDNYICTKADGTKYNFLHTTAVIFGTEIQ